MRKEIKARVAALALALVVSSSLCVVSLPSCSAGGQGDISSSSGGSSKKKLTVDTFATSDFIDYLYIYDMDYVDMAFKPDDVEIEELVAIVSANDGIPEKFKGVVCDYCTVLMEKYPGIELRPFRENLKTLKIVERSAEELSEMLGAESFRGNYSRGANTISLVEGEDMSPGTWGLQAVYHELSHCMRVCVADGAEELLDDLDGWEVHIYPEGKSFNSEIAKEALNSLFAVSLIDSYADEVAYQLQSNYVAVMIECMDNYNLRDYAMRSLSYFAVALNDFNGDERALEIFNLIQEQYDASLSGYSDDYDPEKFAPIYDYLCDMYYRKNVDPSMTYSEARGKAKELLEKVVLGVPIEYGVNYQRFYDNLDAYCDRIGIDR